MPRLFLPLILALALVSPSQAQFAQRFRDFFAPSEVEVTIHHPPALGLDVKRIAFGPTEGEHADEFVDALIADFVSSGVEVVDRQHVEALLAEHEFSLSGVVDREGALELGKILGPAALVFGSVWRCEVEEQHLKERQYNAVTGQHFYRYYARSTGSFKGSIKVIDLTTARIHSARTIQEQLVRQSESTDGFPAFAPQFQVTDAVLSKATAQVHRLFFPWDERATLRFYDDKRCSLKLAFNLVEAGDFEAAYQQSRANLEACESFRAEKPKLLARAYYNLGMSGFLLGDYDQALEHFDQALRLHPHDAISEAIADCRRARQSAIALAEEEEESVLASDVKVATSPGDRREADVGAAIDQSGATSEKSVEDRLKELEELYEKGLITKAVYERKMAEILEEL